MKGSIVDISGRECHLYKDSKAEFLLVQPIDEHDLEVLGQEVEIINELSDKPFSLAALMIKDWNQELTPWSAPPVFGKIPFGSGADDTLTFITSQLLPAVQEETSHVILGGYSLAGLFALWASYQTDKFEGIVAASPSVWLPSTFLPFTQYVFPCLTVHLPLLSSTPVLIGKGFRVRK